MQKITKEEYNVFSKYLLNISGIYLGPGKEYLVETRLSTLIKDLGCASFAELYHKAQFDKTKTLEKKIIDLISTNETYFFRDVAPFELLQHKIIPDLIDKRSSELKINSLPIKIRIWSAASSTGQEIYSIAMVLKELYLDPRKYQIKLLGTDISDSAIAKASYGRYNRFEIARGLAAQKISRYFGNEGDFWRIKDEIRAMVSFKKVNLMESFIGLGKFDIILCRNVAIYFTPQDRVKLYEKIAGVLEGDGYLIIGATESLTNEIGFFSPQRYLRSVFYQLKN